MLKRSSEPKDRRKNDFCLFPQIEPDVERDLVISRPRGMQLFPCRADLPYQFGLDVHMDIFKFIPEPEFPRRYLRCDFEQPFYNGFSVFCGDDTLLREHFCVGDAAPDIMLQSLLSNDIDSVNDSTMPDVLLVNLPDHGFFIWGKIKF